MTALRWTVLALLAASVAAFFLLDFDRFFTLDYFKAQRAAIEVYRDRQFVATVAAFFVGYVAVTGLSLPGATLMTLAAGALFGLGWGTVIVSFASTLGATLAFLVSRFLLRDAIQRRYGPQLATVNRGIEKDGAFYLFTLRLVPAFPFFLINLVMGLTPIKTATFYWVSQLGMLAGTLVYVLAGTQIAQLSSLRGLLSPGLLGAFLLLGLFPWVAKKSIAYIKQGRARHVVPPAEKI
ncbi:MAG: TVP38/TMEM64 family protein [Nevskiales bacterium]|nr:TVP38/TMEM64 family protein [Nevskiales bacterium]